ncbi:Transposon Ty3-G Gag-Pol poly [Paramuricea clavata]|uniref:Transposon Ty3-G Gag-Pol poly n=1 Tax=Paramuricea clavata TaxID=317549 RepID=A0A7D9LIE2_PARCT|nr:Transposon Ty3-G Gag-Pol poly [Paramuricea clavata]
MAGEENFEKLDLKIEEDILSLDVNELVKLANKLELGEENIEGKSRRVLSKLVRKTIDENVELCQTVPKKVEYLHKLQELLEIEPPPLEDATEDTEDNTGDVAASQSPAPLKETTPKVVTVSSGQSGSFTVYRRELKIVGMVGPESQKDRLSFVSLTRQVESGKSKGYTESEVIEAVIRAICPTLKLRSYVETMEGLTLKKLLQILKAHYKQKSATELYHELTILCQDPKESAEDFLIRALELRQQVLFTSRVMEEDVKYSHELVQAVLLRALETGIKSETICAKMRPLFKKHDVTDEELIKGVGDAMSEETERLNKLTLSSRKQAAKVNSCMYDKDGQESKASKNVQSGEKGKRDTLMMTLEAVKADIANIKSSMVANNRNDGKQRPACPKCKSQGNGKCTHCYICGSDEHYARGCKQRSGNGRGLLQRDRK